jgi:AraC family transcriptional regulator of adaptative response / DNA-3-methyladenine glycosylase II
MAIIQDRKSCERARNARDARFDGLFFIAVKTTKIYCRPICPAGPPLEKNVEYHDTAISAAQAGYRPCMRCRPDSAPQSCAWRGTQTTFQRALELIQQGALQEGTIQDLSDRLGISDRYLRELFETNLGTSPKKYAIYQQCLFAKRLLHESLLPITQIAFASGFKSVRRFNEAMQQQLNLSPSQIRKSDKSVENDLQLKLYYRPPFAWQHSLSFLAKRVIPGIEWIEGESYCRTIRYDETSGYLKLTNNPVDNYLKLSLHLDDYRHLNQITQRAREVFDVDAPIQGIDSHLQALLEPELEYLEGLRIPGIWDTFEAGVRAILGQQVSVKQAMNLVTVFVDELGEDRSWDTVGDKKLFPLPSQVVGHSLDFFKMPQSRKDTIRRLAEHFQSSPTPDDVDQWGDIKGIGPWTVNYVKIRGSKDPNIWLAGDAGINNALKSLSQTPDIEEAKPWLSYLTFHLWNQL